MAKEFKCTLVFPPKDFVRNETFVGATFFEAFLKFYRKYRPMIERDKTAVIKIVSPHQQRYYNYRGKRISTKQNKPIVLHKK